MKNNIPDQSKIPPIAVFDPCIAKLPKPIYIDPVAYKIGAILRLVIGFLPFLGKSSIMYKMYNPTKTQDRLDNEFIGSFSNPVLFPSQNPSFSIAGSTPFQIKSPKIKDYPTTNLYELTKRKISVNRISKELIFIYEKFLKTKNI